MSSGIGNYFSYVKEGHKVRDFPNIRSQDKGSGQAQPSATSSQAPKRNHFYDLRSRGEQEKSSDVVTSMLQI